MGSILSGEEGKPSLNERTKVKEAGHPYNSGGDVGISCVDCHAEAAKSVEADDGC